MRQLRSQFEGSDLPMTFDMYDRKRKGEYDHTLADYTKALKELKYFPTKNLKSYIKSKIQLKKQERIYNYA